MSSLPPGLKARSSLCMFQGAPKGVKLVPKAASWVPFIIRPLHPAVRENSLTQVITALLLCMTLQDCLQLASWERGLDFSSGMNTGS